MELVSSAALVRLMEYHGYSARSLAEAVAGRGVPTSKATIGHLMSGHIKRTSPARAKTIARLLDVPVGVLFVAKVSTVQRDVSPTTAGEAVA